MIGHTGCDFLRFVRVWNALNDWSLTRRKSGSRKTKAHELQEVPPPGMGRFEALVG